MGEEEEQLWYYMVEGEQVGPISAEGLQQLAAAGTIHAETQMWTEGLDQWIPATNVEGLLPPEGAAPQAAPAAQPAGEPGKPKLIMGAAAQAAHPLAGEVVSPAAQQQPQLVQTPQAPVAQPAVAQPAVAQPVAAQPVAAQPVAAQPVGVQPGVAQPVGMGMAGPVPPGGEYPPTGTKRASYGLWLGCMLGGFVLLIIGIVVMAMNAEGSDQAAGTAALVFLGLLGIGGLLYFIAVILSYVYLYRAWNCLRFGGPRTSAGKAIGFLFIPFFNLYWIFVAIYGLSQDWNRIRSSYPNLQAAPRMSEGMFLTFLISYLVFAPVGLIFLFIVYKQICDGINFFAGQNLRQQQPGMSFY